MIVVRRTACAVERWGLALALQSTFKQTDHNGNQFARKRIHHSN